MRTSSLIVWLSVEAKRGSPSVCSSEEDDREHLRGEDAQEGRERIDGGVGDAWEIVPNVSLNDFSRRKIEASVNELKEEKGLVADLLG